MEVHELALGYAYGLGLVLWHERRRSWALIRADLDDVADVNGIAWETPEEKVKA